MENSLTLNKAFTFCFVLGHYILNLYYLPNYSVTSVLVILVLLKTVKQHFYSFEELLDMGC